MIGIYGHYREEVIKSIANNGDHIVQIELPISQIYSYPESRRLSREYDVHSHPGGLIPSSLDSASVEALARDLFRFYSQSESFVVFLQKI